MKKVLTTLLSVFLLSSCSLSETGTISGTLSTYETANFKISYPLDWEVIDKSKFEINIPENVIMAIRSNIKNESFTTNVNISVEVPEKEVNVKEFALATMSLAKRKLTSFKEIQLGETTVNNIEGKIPAYYIEYEGKSSPKSPLVQIKQVFLNDNNAIYTLTKANLPTEDESIVNLADLVLNSFVLK
ncbi:MAG: PsbP-related protein [Candidatus Gracilibacteria bacterium]|jgi:hypothetical protein|nr:PsbP-related protein [Candidatus Gracilibacteria bacterium]